MGSSYFGEPNLGNERSGSSRKGKKSNSDKPKQPQRGLGVAQLEKIRLHSQMGSSYLPSLHGPYPTNLNQEDMRQQAAYSSVPSASSFSYTSSSSSSYGFHGHQNATERDLGCIKPIPKMLELKWNSHDNHHYHQDYHHHMLLVKMGFGELERANIIYSDSQPSTTARWNPGNAMIETQHFAQPSMTRHFQNQQVEDSLQKKRKKDRSRSTGSSSQNSESSDTQELDLELRLSL